MAASLSWQYSAIGTLRALGPSVDSGRGSAVTGKLGGRIGGTLDMGHGDKAIFYARAAYVHSFSGKGTGVKVGDYGQGSLGVNILTSGRVSGVIEADGDVGHATRGAGGRVGIQFKL